MRVLILGGDGFCGWPTALHLSNLDHKVVIVDNLSRRDIDNELEVSSLTPILPMSERNKAWREVSGKEIRFININVAKNYHRLLTVIKDFNPEAIVHFAEQSSAPYSMRSAAHKGYTILNNVGGTNNVLAAIVEAGVDSHLVHLGTMGVYGYSTLGVAIPEGYLSVKLEDTDGKEMRKEILYPANPGSIYHMTKTQDQLLFLFYNKNDGIKITDLHQGIVWGTQTAETRLDDRLINRFSYDGDYGTVLNRFIMQAAIDCPLTVHGSGGQTRAFINIQDTVRCIELAIANPPQSGERVRIMNQVSETRRIIDLAQMIAEMTGVEIEHLDNPRNEADNNDLMVENNTLLNLGLDPVRLDRGLVGEIVEIAKKNAERCDRSKIPCITRWRT